MANQMQGVFGLGRIRHELSLFFSMMRSWALWHDTHLPPSRSRSTS